MFEKSCQCQVLRTWYRLHASFPEALPKFGPSTRSLCSGEHDIAIFLPFTLSDSDEHSLTVDIGDLQADRLRDAESGGVAGRQDRAMLDAPHTGQKLQNFFLSQDHRQLLRFFGRWNYFFQVPSPMERDFIEETKSRYSDDNRAWSEHPFVREINLVRANLLRSQYLG